MKWSFKISEADGWWFEGHVCRLRFTRWEVKMKMGEVGRDIIQMLWIG